MSLSLQPESSFSSPDARQKFSSSSQTPIEIQMLKISNLVLYYLHKEEIDAIGRRKK